MARLRMLMGMLFLSVLICLFASCSSSDETALDLNTKNAALSALTPKDQFVADLKVAFGNVKKGEKPHLSMEQINYLEKSAKRMLKSEGMFSKDIKKLEKKNPAALILTGTIYLGLSKCLEAQVNRNDSCKDSTSCLPCDTIRSLSSQRDSFPIQPSLRDTTELLSREK